jgi:hypothetical protein
MMKIRNWKPDTDHSMKECSRLLWCEWKRKAGRGKGKVMNEKEWFCFCGLCICGNTEMFKVNREVISALKQYFIMLSTLLICHSLTPVSASLTLCCLANCIVLLTHIELAPYPGTFTQNVQSCVNGIFMSFFGTVWFLFKYLSYLFLYFRPLLMALFICIVTICC